MDGTILEKKYNLVERVKALEESSYELPVATSSKLGGIKVGNGLSINSNGKLSADDQLPKDPETDGVKVLTATTLNGKTVHSWEEVESGGSVYATTETEVGEYKGEKLYRRLFRFTADSNGNINLDLSAIYKIAFLEWGFCEFPNGSENWKFPLPYFAPGSYNTYLAVVPFVQDHKLRLNVTVANAGEVIHRAVELCILYTKHSA